MSHINKCSCMSLFSVVDFSLSAIVLMLAVCRGVEFELRSFGLFFSKMRSCDIPSCMSKPISMIRV